MIKWWAWQGLNLRPLRCQHEQPQLTFCSICVFMCKPTIVCTRKWPCRTIRREYEPAEHCGSGTREDEAHTGVTTAKDGFAAISGRKESSGFAGSRRETARSFEFHTNVRNAPKAVIRTKCYQFRK